jgi:hypothetical protein
LYHTKVCGVKFGRRPKHSHPVPGITKITVGYLMVRAAATAAHANSRWLAPRHGAVRLIVTASPFRSGIFRRHLPLAMLLAMLAQ